jgi:hypothetical protein
MTGSINLIETKISLPVGGKGGEGQAFYGWINWEVLGVAERVAFAGPLFYPHDDELENF